MTHDTDESNTRIADENTTSEFTERRRLLGGIASVTTVGTGGCLGLFGDGNPERSLGGQANTGQYTTVQKTTTFSYRGARTPFPGVEAIYAGDPGGTLVIVYYDYSDGASLTWWREEFPKLTDLLTDGSLRLTLLMFPKPVDRWSVMLPSALFEVRSQTSRKAAWEFHRSLVSAESYSMELIEELATEMGADPHAVATAAEKRRRRNQTFSDKAMGQDSGVESLPAFRWGMQKIEGISAEAIREFIEERQS